MARPVGSNVAPIAVSRTFADSKLQATPCRRTSELGREHLAVGLLGASPVKTRQPIPDLSMPAGPPVALGVLWAASAKTRGINSAIGYRPDDAKRWLKSANGRGGQAADTRSPPPCTSSCLPVNTGPPARSISCNGLLLAWPHLLLRSTTS
jgi:hypothetical protein